MSNKKDCADKRRLSIRLIVSIVIISICAMTIAVAAAGTAYHVNIVDNGNTITVSTRKSDANDIVNEAQLTLGEKDILDLSAFESGTDSTIYLYRGCDVIIQFREAQTRTIGYNTVAYTLARENIVPGEKEITNYALDEQITDGMLIIVEEGLPVTIHADGVTEKMYVPKGSVKNALDFAGVELGENDETVPAPDKAIRENTEITVNRVSYKERTVKEAIKYKTKTEYVNTLGEDQTKVKQNGSDGEKEVVYRDKYVNGKLIKSEVVSEKTLAKSVDKIVLEGAKKTVPVFASNRINAAKGRTDAIATISNFTLPARYSIGKNNVPTSYKKSMSGSATAYYGGYATSTGKKPQPGYIAVNPNIIPYGTEMWIVSNDGKFVYGYAIAADTGGFIYSGGTIADLYFNTYGECVNFGRRNITIYIL